MPRTVVATYKPNHSDFGKLMLASQTRELCKTAANAGAVYARAYAKGAGLPGDYIAKIRGELGPIAVIGNPPNPRYTGRLIAEHPLAGVFEFGSGQRHVGPGRTTRYQGGYSQPNRVLGRAGARIGSPPRGSR